MTDSSLLSGCWNYAIQFANRRIAISDGCTGHLSWPSKVVEALEAMAKGPDHSHVNCGEVLSIAISDMRASLSLPEPLAPYAPQGYALFFDELISGADSTKWFAEVIPQLAPLLLRLPSLLDVHYQNTQAYGYFLRILGPQQPGMVLLSQELIGALLACSLFCLFPVSNRGVKYLPTINFDHLFASLYDSYNESQEHKVRCIVHYFERICSEMPKGSVSFERKLLSLEHHPSQSHASYPNADFWAKSTVPLCHFQVHSSGLIEDNCTGALEVDFANEYLGGGALHRGCEEIRFMINPELVAGMLFLPSMEENEAIEIVGAERFSGYKGYASSFRFSGDYVDNRSVDFLGRRQTRIVAIDALCSPRMKQYKLKYLLRETNKAFCGFLDQSKYRQYKRLYQDNELGPCQLDQDNNDGDISRDEILLNRASSTFIETNEANEGECMPKVVQKSNENGGQFMEPENCFGIATGNWGCGAFGGDPELKTIIQWLAASQALRPFISYYTFGHEALKNLTQPCRFILVLPSFNIVASRCINAYSFTLGP
ncbi:Poly(ADP-ribose) glycohydrolase [Corchorus olitorius]|uniref:poly(ADP-ribose) glycohydrolase n=1 Tax=Corchorus olitorius TaxID=93759 RepID=A0A1R3IXY1_9ROSI|nr:Poly(ADP-ribose) glycohydrolase [Corchorus olitorius]